MNVKYRSVEKPDGRIVRGVAARGSIETQFSYVRFAENALLSWHLTNLDRFFEKKIADAS
jgi:hypothetical protein